MANEASDFPLDTPVTKSKRSFKKVLFWILAIIILIFIFVHFMNTQKCNKDGLCSPACDGVPGCHSKCKGKYCILTMDGRKGEIKIPQSEVGIGGERLGGCLTKEPPASATAGQDSLQDKVSRGVKNVTRPFRDAWNSLVHGGKKKNSSSSTKSPNSPRKHPRSARSSSPPRNVPAFSPRQSQCSVDSGVVDGSSVHIDTSM